MNKEDLRQQYRLKRMGLSTEEVRDLSGKISEKFMAYLGEHQEICHVHLFLPIARFHEVDTLPLFYKLQDLGYSLYTSRLNPSEENLETLNISSIKGFDSGHWGIPVPGQAAIEAPDNIQLLLIPLLAYDKKGYRIGYGKGYYDKFLATLGRDIIKVGLSFFPPEDHIPVEPHDIPMDFCITPKDVFFFYR
ncbi:5-formyltetrahydrofolate cyclo-ligase [Cecembia sp.]|uniref:5-formyltetrahydrofolate cyclo-ligase n=1 Tax=Cecembia sp. TaxID=1898110 RepID=UPI0025C20189|nr:5-formyltetrahydrofolate cyclo-ligase [Cecembia sp.]